MSVVSLVILAAVAATVYSFICGVTTMATHTEVGHHTGEQWMIRRVGFQALAVLLVLLAVALR